LTACSLLVINCCH